MASNLKPDNSMINNSDSNSTGDTSNNQMKRCYVPLITTLNCVFSFSQFFGIVNFILFISSSNN